MLQAMLVYRTFSFSNKFSGGLLAQFFDDTHDVKL